jgi:ketosteroid isomerase-like protein
MQVAQTADSILFTGGMKRPFVRGQGQPELKPGVAERKGASIVTKVRRVEVARSGDMAYEFSDVDATIIEGSGKSRTFQASLLRVWKKVDGKWQVAARFQAPHEE